MSRKDTNATRQEAVALCLAEGKSKATTARECRVGIATVWRWVKQPHFRKLVAELRAQLTDRTIGLLASSSARAVLALRKDLKDVHASNRIKASDVLLTHDAKAREAAELRQQLADIQEQLAQLERTRAKGNKGGK